MNNKDKIIKYIKDKGLATPSEIGKYIGVGQVMIHRYIKKLVTDGILTKRGQSPKVYYSLNNAKENLVKNEILDKENREIIEQNFTLLQPDGSEFIGVRGFVKWCEDRKYKIEDKAEEYVKMLKHYEHFKKGSVINATVKLSSTFKKEKTFLDSLYYLHPYSLPVFGKTKIATWLFHAKQTQNKILMNRVFEVVVPEIRKFIKDNDFSAIAFIPPTVPRTIQIMKELQKNIASNLPTIKIEKIKTQIMVQQKSLRDIEDRVMNAENTMVIQDTNSNYKKVLLVDDFTGSGSTLNVIAGKIKQKKIADEVIGLTITGSMNGFDVIKEM